MRTFQSPRILVCLARHGADRYPEAIADLLEFYRRVLPKARYDLVVVDNALTRPTDEPCDGYRLLSGDNRGFEFTAWEKALTVYHQELAGYDLVHLATSAFMVPYNGYLDHIGAAQLRLCARRDFCLGHIDAYPEPIEVQGWSSRAWIRTSFFFLSPRALARLGSVVSVKHPEIFFTDEPEVPFLPGAPLSERYRNYLLAWLNGSGIDGFVWHSRFDRTRDNMEFFRRKATAILNEHLLSIRLRACGVPTIDAAWLRYRSEDTPLSLPLETPVERQLELRTEILSGRLPFPGALRRRVSEFLAQLPFPRLRWPR